MKKKIGRKIRKGFTQTVVFLLITSNGFLVYSHLRINKKLLNQDKKIEVLTSKIKNKDYSNTWAIVLKNNLPFLIPIGYSLGKELFQYCRSRPDLTNIITTRVLDRNLPQETENSQKIKTLMSIVEATDPTPFRAFLKISLIQVKKAISEQNIELLLKEEEFQVILQKIMDLGQNLKWDPKMMDQYKTVYEKREKLLKENRNVEHKKLYNQLKEDFLTEQIRHDQLMNSLKQAERLIEHEKKNLDDLQIVMDRQYQVKRDTEQEIHQCCETLREAQNQFNVIEKKSQKLQSKIDRTSKKVDQLTQKLKQPQKNKKIKEELQKVQKQLKIFNNDKKLVTKKIKTQERKIQSCRQKIDQKQKIVQEKETILKITYEDFERSQDDLNDLETRTQELRDKGEQSDQKLEIKEMVISNLYQKNRGVFKTIKEAPKLLLNKLRRYAESLG